jgi:hypothetical protein
MRQTVEWRFLKQELPTLPGTHEFTTVFSGVHVTRSFDLSVMVCILFRQFLLQKSPFYHKDKDMIEGYFNIREIAHRRYMTSD